MGLRQYLDPTGKCSLTRSNDQRDPWKVPTGNPVRIPRTLCSLDADTCSRPWHHSSDCTIYIFPYDRVGAQMSKKPWEFVTGSSVNTNCTIAYRLQSKREGVATAFGSSSFDEPRQSEIFWPPNCAAPIATRLLDCKRTAAVTWHSRRKMRRSL